MKHLNKILILCLAIVSLACSSGNQADVYHNLVLKYEITDKTECNGFGGKGEFYLAVADKFSSKDEVEIFDLNEAKNEYRKSGKITTNFRFSGNQKHAYYVSLLDKNLLNTFMKSVGKIVDRYYRLPLEMFDEYLKDYQLCGQVEIKSSDLRSEKKYSINDDKGKQKLVIHASGE
ncbi:MAG: hypothetical protein PHV24_08800 [Candidatus Kapabacteria bacterium]|nr:hypothetical protein [Candidatus Kapabacteria bacterium]